jgi:hypothetical protein
VDRDTLDNNRYLSRGSEASSNVTAGCEQDLALLVVGQEELVAKSAFQAVMLQQLRSQKTCVNGWCVRVREKKREKRWDVSYL